MMQNGTDKKTALRRNILVALLYFGLGAGSLLLELVPEIATPLWPAAGMALGAVLLWGNTVLPGILLGALFTNIFAVSQAGAASSGFTVFFVPLGISTAVLLQAWLGAKLVRTCVRFPNYLESGRDIALFLLLGGPVGCLVSASLAVTWLSIVGVVPPSSAFFQWFTWWAGDTIGVLIVAPLFVLLASCAAHISVKRKFTVTLPLVMIAAISFAVFLWVKHVEGQSVRLRFQTETSARTNQIADYTRNLLNMLHTVAGFYVASQDVTEDEFYSFTRDILARYPEIRHLQWVPYVTGTERRIFEAKAEKKLGRRFRITEKTGDSTPATADFAKTGLVTADSRDDYFPVYFSAPETDDNPYTGFDLGSIAGKRRALEAARREKTVKAGAPLRFSDSSTGVLIADPVFKNGGDEASGKIEGFVIAAIDTPHLIKTLLENSKQTGISVWATDKEAEPEDGFLFSVIALGVADDRVLMQTIKQIDIAGRLWKIAYTATPEYFSAYRPWPVWFTMIGGVAFVSLLQFLLLVITGQTSATQRIVAERTQALKRSNAELEQFAYAASHDLKTPLRHISICAEFINDGDGNRLAKETREYLDVIRKSTKHMSTLIDSLLDYARINHSGSAKEYTALNDVFDVVKEDMASVIAENDAAVTRDDLPVVYADGQLLSRVFLNLLDNALKYKDPVRPPRIHISCKYDEKDWTICVSDNGIGIAPQFSEKIFEVFQRLHSDTDYSGTGIGLPACKRIIEYHKGRIWLDTDYEDGSRFCFTLPHRNII